MPTPAYLCVGASESLLRLGTRFDLQEVGGAFLYVRDRAGMDPGPAAVSVPRGEGA
jgi:chemotaxis protein methyltransferase CheR